MSTLEKRIGAVLKVIQEAQTSDFTTLAELAGLDPKTDFVGADLRGTNLSGVDFSKFNFSSADLTDAVLPPEPVQNRPDVPHVPRLISRQGDRLGQALDELLRTGEAPMRNGVRTKALSHLRDTSVELRALSVLENIERSLTEKDAIRVLSRALGPVMGPNRGMILYDFANRLAKYPLIRQHLGAKLHQSRAYSILTIYGAIEERLQAPLETQRRILERNSPSTTS